MVFKDLQSPLRTNSSFRAKSNNENYLSISLLTQIASLDMVNQFPLDYMHLVCLGVTKKLLLTWMSGKYSVQVNA